MCSKVAIYCPISVAQRLHGSIGERDLNRTLLLNLTKTMYMHITKIYKTNVNQKYNSQPEPRSEHCNNNFEAER